jgi:hypothetical protein
MADLYEAIDTALPIWQEGQPAGLQDVIVAIRHLGNDADLADGTCPSERSLSRLS